MKIRITVSIIALLLTLLLNAQTSKTVTIVAGGLKGSLTASELRNVISLTVYGTIDARDFKTMRDDMKSLKAIDLRTGCDSICQYTGSGGTAGAKVINYPAHEVPKNALYNCLYLSSVELPLTVISIGEKSFYDCSVFISCKLPDCLKRIGNSAFNMCANMTTINFPSSITEIGDSAFYFCLFIPTASIPNVTKMGKAVFYQCLRMSSVVLPTHLETLEESTFEKCLALTTVTLPASLKYIAKDVFKSNQALTTLTLPQGIVEIKDSVFINCKSLKTLQVLNPVPVDLSISKNVFFKNPLTSVDINKDSCTLIVPAGTLAAYKAAPQWREFTHIVEQTPTAINVIPSKDIKFSIFDNLLTIKGLFGNEQIYIYTVSGSCITAFTASKETANCFLPQKGIYLVRVGQESFKLINR